MKNTAHPPIFFSFLRTPSLATIRCALNYVLIIINLLKSTNYNTYIQPIILALICLLVFRGYDICHCGIEGSKILTQQGLELSKAAIKSKHTIQIQGISGICYELESTLFKFDKGFVTQLNLNSESKDIKLTKKELYNNYKHIFMNFYMDEKSLKKYIYNELSDNLRYSTKQIEEVQIGLYNEAINFISTKQALFKHLTEDGELVNLKNYIFSDYLITGEKTNQYLSGVAHIIKDHNFLELMQKYTDKTFYESLQYGENPITMFENIKIDKDGVFFMNALLGDMLNIYNPLTEDFKMKSTVVFDNFEINCDVKTIKKIFLTQEEIVDKEKKDQILNALNWNVLAKFEIAKETIQNK